MKIERLIKRLSSESNEKVVIAIDGYSGSGKTTLLKKLAKHDNMILPVFIDDFIRTNNSRRASLKNASDKSKVVELKWNNIQKIQQLIRAFRTSVRPYPIAVYNQKTDRYDKNKTFNCSKKVLILEGIFLFHPKLFTHTFDVRIYLDADTKEADVRRIKRENRRWGKKYFPEDHPDSFVRLFKIAYARYLKLYQPKKIADDVF